jgi:flagellar motor switch protein FliN/FliY
MTNKLLQQEEIDALLNGKEPESGHPEEEYVEHENHEPLESAGVDSSGEQNAAQANGAVSVTEQPAMVPSLLTDEEKDALGEVGNICMGSSSTTLSMLLNQPVNITSPRVTITTMEELLKSFVTPHMSIRVRFIEGLSGYNLLIMRVQDAAVLADLMMGGDGISTSDELTEIGISAASEAMNQMIGAASTAMATMFSRTVNISPPVTKIYHSPEELTSPEQSQVVVVWFKMTIGSVLDTQIMQVMDMDTAREEAGLILGQLLKAEGEECLPAQEEPHAQVANHSSLPEQQAHIETSSARPPAAKRSATTQSGLDQQRLGLILDIPLKVTVLLGRTRWPIKDILELTPGSVVELQSLVDEPVEVLINGTLVAMGEVVVVNENFGVRLTNIIKPEERLQKLRK